MMRRDRRLMALAQIAADVVIVLMAAQLMSLTAAAILAVVLGVLFVRWWLRSSR